MQDITCIKDKCFLVTRLKIKAPLFFTRGQNYIRTSQGFVSPPNLKLGSFSLVASVYSFHQIPVLHKVVQ